MFKKISILLGGSILAAVAAPTKADVWTVGSQPIVYPPDRFPVFGDGSSPYGGTPPYYAQMPSDIPTVVTWNPNQFIASTTDGTLDANGNGVIAQVFKTRAEHPGDAGLEAKFRTVCGTFSHMGYNDPLIYPGQPNASHLHVFFGNTLTTAMSNYRTLRQSGRSNCGGDVFNRTAYWIAALLAQVNGQTMVVRTEQFVVYYVKNPIDEALHMVDIPRDFGYVIGPDPMHGYVDDQVAEVAAANAASQAIGGKMFYEVATPRNGFVGWKCENPKTTYNVYGGTQWSPFQSAYSQPYLKTADGHPTLACKLKQEDGVTPARLIEEYDGQGCWDGKNGHGGPDARRHVRQMIWATDTTTGVKKKVCPDTWFEFPSVIMTAYYSINVDNEWTNWRKSSDDAGSYHYLNGESGHMDWFGAWDYGTSAQPGVMLTWMHNCLGTMGNTPAECNYSTISRYKRLLSDSPIPAGFADPPGSNRTTGQIVDYNHYYQSRGVQRFVPIPKGPYHIMAH